MVKSELEQKLCHMYPNMLRKDIEKIIDITSHLVVNRTAFKTRSKKIRYLMSLIQGAINE